VYKTKESADAACEKLNGGKLPEHPQRSVKVIPSNAKNKLFVGAIPNDMTEEQVLEAFKAEVQGARPGAGFGGWSGGGQPAFCQRCGAAVAASVRAAAAAAARPARPALRCAASRPRRSAAPPTPLPAPPARRSSRSMWAACRRTPLWSS
jgi:hypothetical protein